MLDFDIIYVWIKNFAEAVRDYNVWVTSMFNAMNYNKLGNDNNSSGCVNIVLCCT